jgi:D-glycero-D-manno-heptose 1,7-bisphosphate phosphatase
MKRALFLDRDGVVNVDHGYVHSVEHFEFVDGIFELCRAAVQRGRLPVVVTNQAGIGRGYYDETQFQSLTRWMLARFEAEGAPIAAVYHCPFHPEHGIGAYRIDSIDRKPRPGMLLRARDELGLALEASMMVGDTASDMLAAHRAGVPVRCLLSASGRPPGAQAGAGAEDTSHTHVVPTLRDAMPLLDLPP